MPSAHLARGDPVVGGYVRDLAGLFVSDDPRALLVEVQSDTNRNKMWPAVSTDGGKSAQVPFGPEVQEQRGEVCPVGLP